MSDTDWMRTWETGPYEEAEPFNAIRDLKIEVERLRALCSKAAHHLRTIPIQSDYKDGLMAAELEAEGKP
jgi:hypothetical protein